MHDSAVSSVSIVEEGTLDRDEVILIICFFAVYVTSSDPLQNIVLNHGSALQDLAPYV